MIKLDPCTRCGHPADWHRHDGAHDCPEGFENFEACPFRCLGYDCEAPGAPPDEPCDCPNYVDPAITKEER